ncbi:MAG: selenium-dependent molybdenum cofactor biosynthesis protein YqeB [Rectinemataceae bacterium]
MIPCRKGFILVRGAGDIATGVILRLVHAGFRVAALETEKPTAIRRTVALSEAVYDGEAQVENIRARRVASPDELLGLLGFLELPGLPGLPSAFVPILVDPDATSLEVLRPEVLVDAILAKRNTGTSIGMAPLTIALGPGFEAAVDVHFVVETNRGHTLGRVITSGSAEPDTGIPGEIGGFARERVLKSPIAGIVEPLCAIGDKLRSGDPLLAIHAASGDRERIVLVSPFDGIVRGLLRPGFKVTQGFKIADVDPRCRPEHCRTVSDKALAIAGGVLEAVMAAGLRPPDREPGIGPKAGDLA